jgi:NAD dependent epimerase/dehydratase family enzyme
MKIAITGASGFLGRRLTRRLQARGHTVRAVSLRLLPTPDVFAGCDAVVNLAGEKVAQRWSPEVRARIESSRVEGTSDLVAALREHPPKVLVSGSAVGYYGSRGDEVLLRGSALENHHVVASGRRERSSAQSLENQAVETVLAVELADPAHEGRVPLRPVIAGHDQFEIVADGPKLAARLP